MKVLVIEDDVLQRELFIKILGRLGHVVFLAGDGAQAITRARVEAFDLFVMDVFLPDMTALELIPRMRCLQPDARIITLTGQSSRELERRLRELGIAYYLAKPFQCLELQTVVSHLARTMPKPADRPGNPTATVRADSGAAEPAWSMEVM